MKATKTWLVVFTALLLALAAPGQGDYERFKSNTDRAIDTKNPEGIDKEIRATPNEVSDDRFRLLPEYSGDRAGTAQQRKGIESPVTWPGEDLSVLGGKTVRLRLHLRNGRGAEPRLYAFYIRSDS